MNNIQSYYNANLAHSANYSINAESILDAIRNASDCKNKNFTIVVDSKSTVTSLFIISGFNENFLPQHSIIKVPCPVNKLNLPWVDKIVEFSINNLEDKALKEISLITTFLKSNNKIGQISEGVFQLSSYDLLDIVAIAILRNTFSVRDKIICWGNFLSVTEHKLNSKGRDSKKLLRGLNV